MFNSILTTTDTSISMSKSVLCIVVALALGLVNSLCYMFTQKKGSYTKDFAVSVTLLPAIVAIVIILVGSNIARAFSMAGAFALVRFRSVPGSSKDIAVIFFTMAVGLAAGLGFIGFAAVVTAVICIALIIMSITKFGEFHTESKLLKITIPENLNYKDVFKDIFEENLTGYTIEHVKTTNMGSMYELQYVITMKKDADEKAFIDAIRCRNGNLNIFLGNMPDKTGLML